MSDNPAMNLLAEILEDLEGHYEFEGHEADECRYAVACREPHCVTCRAIAYLRSAGKWPH